MGGRILCLKVQVEKIKRYRCSEDFGPEAGKQGGDKCDSSFGLEKSRFLFRTYV